MANAITNSAYVAVIPEATWGTTPATPAMQKYAWRSIRPIMEKQSVTPDDNLNAAEISDIVQVAARGGLEIGIAVKYGSLDTWLESLFNSSFSADVLKVGTTRKSLSIELGLPDIGQYAVLTGAIVTGLSLTVANGQIVQATIQVRSKFPTWATSAITGATYTAPTTNSVMDPVSQIQLVQEGGAGSIAGPTEFSMDLRRDVIDFPQLGSVNPLDLQSAQFIASGRFSAYFADRTYIDKLVNWTTTSIAATIGGSASKKYAFSFAKAKLSATDVPYGAPNQPVVQQISWQAFYDSTDTTAKVTRTA